MYRYFLKRFFDLLAATFLIPIWLIIILFISSMIYFHDRGQIFYNSNRLGKNGKLFKMYKFRSMKINAPDIRNQDGSTFNSEDDQRLTKIGKFIRKTSLDETPQLINIIRGDMSFVGPRPDLPEHINMYSSFDKRKLEIRPGVTGYNQAYFRNSIPWKERIINDVYYVDHVTFVFDIKILLKTTLSIIKRDNVFSKNKTTN